MTKQEMIQLLKMVKTAIANDVNNELAGHSIEKAYFAIEGVIETLEEGEE